MFKLAFSTLGCPDWTLKQAIAAAHRYGFAAIELRALRGTLDLFACPEFQPNEIAATRRFLQDENAAICCVGTSCKFDDLAADVRAQNVEAALRHCDLAAELGAQMIRVTPDKIPAGATRSGTRARIVESLRTLAERAPENVRIGLETHGDFVRARDTTEIINSANHPALAAIWDPANAMETNETIADGARAIAAHLAHVHLRDARPVDNRQNWLSTLAGTGRVSFREVVARLAALDYHGYLSFEWLRYWQPEIAAPEIALPDFVAAVRRAAAETQIGVVAFDRRED